jgi:hypothetical protein
MTEGPILIGRYLGSGACGSAFLVEGDDTKVIKIARLIDYKYADDGSERLEISSINSPQRNLNTQWIGGIALNEFQAIMFEKLANMEMVGESYTSTLPKTYSFTSGEMQQALLDDITLSRRKYSWDNNKYQELMNSFSPSNGFFPGTRIGLWVMEKLESVGGRISGEPWKQLNKWLLDHNMIVRDTKNTGNYGFRKDGSIAWFDPGVCPWPIEKDWKNSENIQLQNLYYGFINAYGSDSKLKQYGDAIEKDIYIQQHWQSEDGESHDIIKFLAESEEVIGKYIDAGAAGSVYALNGDKVLKIVRLNHTFGGQYINKEQADFIEDVYIRKLDGEPINKHFVDIQHYNRGTATEELTEIVNEKAKKKHSQLKKGEPIAIWVMERLPVIGDRTDEGGRTIPHYKEKGELKEWAKSIGYDIHDLHDANYGSRKDGTWVAFDPWPKRM